METPLREIIHSQNLSSNGHITWTPEAEQAFIDMKCALQSPPTLDLPDPMKLFTQTVEMRLCDFSVAAMSLW